jgi:hypothetical protein
MESFEIALRIRPRDAKVKLDGLRVEGDTLRVPNDGKARLLSVSAEGYATQERRIERTTESPIHIDLQAEPGSPRHKTAAQSPRETSGSTPATTSRAHEAGTSDPAAPAHSSSPTIKPKGPVAATL